MSNVWLQQIFRNDGEVSDIYVSRQIRPNKRSCFSFRLSREVDAYGDIQRNNDLMIKGLKEM